MDRKIERLFVEHIIHQDMDDSSLLDEIIGAGDLTAAEALAIYRGDYNARLEEALQNKYEGVYLIAGDELFSSLAQLFLNSITSKESDLQKFGDEFPAWLKTSAPLNEGMSFLPEIAKIDLAFNHLFHLDPIIDQSSLLSPDPSLIYLNLSAPLILVHAQDSSFSLWCHRYDEELPPGFNWGRDEFILLFKNRDRKILFQNLDQSFYHFMQDLKNGHSLFQAFSHLSKFIDLSENSSDIIRYQELVSLLQNAHFLSLRTR